MTSKQLALVDNLPKMSPLTVQLLRVLSKANCSVTELTEIAKKDAALSARILRTANSATFGRIQAVGSLRHAISIQGVNLLRKFVLGASVANLFSRTKGTALFSMLRFNLHSVATGALLDILTEELPVEHSHQAFVAGLLHDVGEMLIAINLPKEYEHILQLSALTGESQIECERKILGIDHAQLSGLAVHRWQLDETLREAVEMHHTVVPQEDLKSLKLSNAIREADQFVNSLGISIPPPTAESLTPPELNFEGFPFAKERVLHRFQDEWIKLADMFK